MTRRAALDTIVVVALASIATVAKANAGAAVTISCDKPNGFNISYDGLSLAERVEASQKNQPSPKPTGPNEDSYAGKPTFVIDSNREKMAVFWAELPEDVLPRIPPRSATDATIVSFEEQISAIQVDPWSIMTYSFFPRLGIAFINQQSIQPESKNVIQLATFAHCEFSWADPRQAPR